MARIAGRAYGVVTRSELLDAGLTADQIRHRLATGALIPVYRGVYLVGHAAPSTEARYMAAVKACGKGAVLGGRSAGHFLSLLTGPPPPLEVIAPTQRRVGGVCVRHSRSMDPRDAWTFRRMPVTTVPRTLVDLAGVLDPEQLARSCHEAAIRYRTNPAHVEAVLGRRPNSRGAAGLRRVIRGDANVTLSRLERRFLELLGAGGFPAPRTNDVVAGRRVDCHWPEHRLIVELDGYRYHGSRHAWENDRRREREARAAGNEFRRYTYGDVFEHPRLMLRELRGLLPTSRR